MNLDTLKNLDKKYAKAIADYLLNRIETDECLLNKLNETPKTLKGCIEYIKGEAKKEAEDGCAIIQDNQVYEWSVHYFLEDSLDCEPKQVKDKKQKKTNDDEEQEEQEEEETPKTEETLFGEEEIIKTKSKPRAKAEKPKQEVKEKITEQLSLFDF